MLRLVQAGWVERYWEQDETAEAEGRPRRRYYRITQKGIELAADNLPIKQATATPTRRSALRPDPGSDGRCRITCSAPVSACQADRSGSAPARRSLNWPRADSRIGAVVYATLGSIIVWLIIDVLPHIRITYR